MSVLKDKRQKSQFEVFHHYYKPRKEITDLLLRDFGFSTDKADARVRRMFRGKPEEEMSEGERARYEKIIEKNEAFDEWFILEERRAVLVYLRNLGMYVFAANNIYPQYEEELIERRLYQDKALGCCEVLMQELQYVIETLPVDINKYTRFAEMLQMEINLIKAWRKADNKFKKNFDQ